MAAETPVQGRRPLISFVFTLSRFRFWIYTGGTYVVGYALGMGGWADFFRPDYYLSLFYFFVPANILIYGVNDYWDEATDRLNPKKKGKEQLLAEKDRRRTLLLLGLVGIFSLALLVTQDTTARLIFLAFLFLGYFYSAPPLRFKQVPVLDFASNMLYIMPGIFGYYLASGLLPPAIFVLAGFLHITAMHVYSAIPDIGFDRSAGITTTPVWMGKRPALLLCLVAWLVFAAIVLALSGFHPLALPVLVYPLFPAIGLARRDIAVERLYWYLPYVNTLLGGLLFTAVTLSKMPASFPPFF